MFYNKKKIKTIINDSRIVLDFLPGRRELSLPPCPSDTLLSIASTITDNLKSPKCKLTERC